MRGGFAPPGVIWQYLETFYIVTALRVCYGHLVGRAQGCYFTSCSEWSSPTTKDGPAQTVGSAKVVQGS